MSLTTLPPEILHGIAHRLNTERDLSAVARTCRLLHVLLTHLLYSNNIQNRRQRALFWAARKGQPQTAQRVIDAGADLRKIRDRHRQTPLHYAAYFGHKSVVELLVAHGADIDAYDRSEMSPLHYAAQQNRVDIAKFFLSKGVDPNLRHPGLRSCTPLHVAARNGHNAVVRLLLEYGADINVKDTVNGATALHLALRPCLQNGISILDPLVSVNDWNQTHKIPLYEDFLAQQTIALALIEMGADLDAKNTDHESCLMLAVREGYVVVVQQMLDKGVDWSLGANALSSEDIIRLDRMLSRLRPGFTQTRTCSAANRAERKTEHNNFDPLD